MTAPARLGKYEVTEVLGTGAMGVVYKGFDPGIRRIVAIKTIRRELIAGDKPAAMMLQRFRNEAQAAGKLAHPGIVAVYDYGEDAEVAYIAMEYVAGNSLREYLARGTRFSERDAVSVMSQLLDALAHAHERRVWHRDIKPANLIVMMNGRVKVADFGIARIETSDLTQTGAVMGSPGYMAPEQYAAAAIDHRADVFAAGVVFYQLLTGARPFSGTTEQVAYAICHTEPARPSVADRGKGWERYDALLAQALAKRPEDRFQTADAFRKALVEAHARPAATSIAEETIITEILRPAAALEPTAPSRPRAGAPVPAAKPTSRRGWIAAAGIAAMLVAIGAVWVASSRKEPPAPVATAPAAPAATSPAAPAPAPRPQPDQEVVFWESVRNSTNRAELEAYLAKYPEGAFAPLARARIEALAAAEAKRLADAKRSAEPPAKSVAAPPPEARKPFAPPAPAAATPRPEPGQEALFWESVRASRDPAELRAYLAKYPDGTFAPLARARLDALAAAAAKRAAEPQLNIPPRAGAEARSDTLRPPVQAAIPPQPAPAAGAPGRFDGRWTARMACDPFMEQEAVRFDWPTEIRGGEVQLTRGTPGQPGYWQMQGRIGDGDRLTLVGTNIARSKAYYGQNAPARFDGRFGADGYEGVGGFGKRNCTLRLTRAGS